MPRSRLATHGCRDTPVIPSHQDAYGTQRHGRPTTSREPVSPIVRRRRNAQQVAEMVAHGAAGAVGDRNQPSGNDIRRGEHGQETNHSAQQTPSA